MPSGIHFLTSPITIRGKNGTKVNITGIRDIPHSRPKTGFQNHITTAPLIFGNYVDKRKSEKGLGIMGSLDSNLITHGHEQSRLYGSNGSNIDQNSRNNNNNRNWNDPSVLSSTNAKSRVPEIHMINKYYGLIPKKFTMHSRRSADQNQRNGRTGVKLRAKSAVTLISTKKSSLDDSDSTSEYNEPSGKVKGRRGSSGGGPDRSEEMGDKSFSSSSPNKQNHVELVTTKMSVEKQQKKWRLRRSSSLSLMENGSQGNCHAKKADTADGGYKDANQRVIRIDLNNMKWEETYQSNSPSDEPQSPSPDNSPRYMENVNNNPDIINSPTFYDDTRTTSANFRNGPPNSLDSKPQTPDNSCERAATNHNNLALNPNKPTPNSEDTRNDGDSSIVVGQMRNPSTYNRNGGNINSGSTSQTSGSVIGESCGIKTATDSTESISASRRQRLRKTISFDDQLLRSGDTVGGSGSNVSGQSEREAMKPKRPMTASTRVSHTSNNNGQTPPSKVHPWTQRSGQGMSLSERRAKLQKSVSNQSTDSFDYGDGEGSDLEGELSSATTASFKSPTVANIPSAYKEIRKSLSFHPPPEVATMISLVSPIETLEIQYEIEKVAVMLKNMQNQNKSFIDLCPADASSSSKVDKAIRHPNRDNELSKDTTTTQDDINGNPTAGLNSAPPGDNLISPEAENACGLSREKVGQSHSGCGQVELADLNKPQTATEPCGVDLPFDQPETTASVMDSNSSKDNLEPQESHFLPSSGEVISGQNSIKSENPISSVTPIIPIPPGSCTTDPNSLKVQALPLSSPPSMSIPPQILPSAPGARRPPLKKSVSISCEKELLQTPGCQNEVNGNGAFSSQTNENKGSRPKTASISTPKPFLRSSSTSKLVLTSASSPLSNSHRARPKVTTTTPSRITNKAEKPTPTDMNNEKASVLGGTTGTGESNQSQALRNRKILIKKALIEINQSSASLGKKWGILGRPKTAPSPGAGNNNKKPVTATTADCGQNQKRQPLKASPPPPPATVKPGQPVAKGVILNPKIEPIGQNNALSEDKGGPEAEMDDSVDTTLGNRRTLKRQSFSLDEGLLLGFSNKEFGWDSPPDGPGNYEDSSNATLLSTKKREECLKIYEKMMKTGFAVKLDTIFRGMMTPSEYRAFIKAAETAAREAADAARAAEEEAIENNGSGKKKEVDAGVNLDVNVDSTEHRRNSILKLQTLKSI